MRRSSSLLTSGRSRTPRTRVKIAALAPMPRARVRMTVVASPLTRASDRAANLKSVMRLISTSRLKVREIDTSACGMLSPDAPAFLLFRLQHVEQGVQALEAALPELAVALHPLGGFRERSGVEPARP